MSHLTNPQARAGWRVPRKLAVGGGLLLLVAGAWGAIVPFVGPYFDYGFGPNSTWTWTLGRFWLEVLPGAAAFVAGGVLIAGGVLRTGLDRATTTAAAGLAALAGVWFIVGAALAPLWDSKVVSNPLGGTTRVALDWVGLYFGVGALILLVGAAAVGLANAATLGNRPVPVQPYPEEATTPAAPVRSAAPVATASPTSDRRESAGSREG